MPPEVPKVEDIRRTQEMEPIKRDSSPKLLSNMTKTASMAENLSSMKNS